LSDIWEMMCWIMAFPPTAIDRSFSGQTEALGVNA
jgi:hypothetical protein